MKEGSALSRNGVIGGAPGFEAAILKDTPQEAITTMKVMVIDDVMINIMVVKHTLKSLGQVDGFQEHTQALSLLRRAYEEGTPYDVLFLDIVMPTGDGMEVLQEVQEMGRKFAPENPTKVVMITGKGDRDSVNQAIRYGAAGYLLKPLKVDRILKEIRRLSPNTEDGRGA